MTSSPLAENAPTSVEMHTQKYRPDIDGLRAVAVLSVVAYHAFPETIRGGFIGRYLLCYLRLSDLYHSF